MAKDLVLKSFTVEQRIHKFSYVIPGVDGGSWKSLLLMVEQFGEMCQQTKLDESTALFYGLSALLEESNTWRLLSHFFYCSGWHWVDRELWHNSVLDMTQDAYFPLNDFWWEKWMIFFEVIFMAGYTTWGLTYQVTHSAPYSSIHGPGGGMACRVASLYPPEPFVQAWAYNNRRWVWEPNPPPPASEGVLNQLAKPLTKRNGWSKNYQSLTPWMFLTLLINFEQ